tara:strand:- start:206 stop:1060 length:855 start_codon:yes stop_codon:yes gene_type:complete
LYKIENLKKLYFENLYLKYSLKEIENIFLELILFKKQWEKVEYLLHKNQLLNDEEITFMQFALQKLKKNIPVQHIIGHVIFNELTIKVNTHVLIPRVETEELVHLIYNTNLNNSPSTILDIGTGSGCIILALKKIYSKAKCVGLDISKEAVNMAIANAKINSLLIDFINADIHNYSVNEKSLDIIVSNPPYIPLSNQINMHENVLENDPHLALFVEDSNPLKFYKIIAEFGNHSLKEKGKIYFEIHEDFANDIVNLLVKKGYKNCDLYKDFQGKNRFVVASKNE